MSVLNHNVLALNRGWVPTAVTTVERAIILLTSEYPLEPGQKKAQPKAVVVSKAADVDEFRAYTWEDWSELVASDNERVVRSARASFRVPEIIALTRYNELPQQRQHFSRRTIYKRDNNQCQYCMKRPGTEELSIDHIIPRSKGGLTTWTNCCLACVECNRFKADILPKKKTILETMLGSNGQKKTRPVVYYTVTFSNGKKSWEATIREPRKPKFTFYKGEIKYQSWVDLLGEAYWLTELENDIDD